MSKCYNSCLLNSFLIVINCTVDKIDYFQSLQGLDINLVPPPMQSQVPYLPPYCKFVSNYKINQSQLNPLKET